MKIVVKESDKLKSSIHKNLVISEYLIYLMNDDKSIISCFIAVGEQAKKSRINDLYGDYPNQGLKLEEMSFDVFRKQ